MARRHFGNVRRLPSGRWQANYWHEGTRHIASDTFKTKADALAWLSGAETDIHRGGWVDPRAGTETFGRYARDWLEHRTDLRPSTLQLYNFLFERWLMPAFGDVRLSSLNPEAWRHWYAKASADHPGSLQPGKAYKLARAILNTAVEDGRLVVNPVKVKGAGVEHSPERPIATIEQVFAIADAIEPRYRALVLVGAFVSARFGEAVGLRRRRIDLEGRRVVIEEGAVELAKGEVVFGPPKSEAGRRTVAIPAEIVPDLAAHLEEFVGAGDDALVFTSPLGYPLRRTKFRLPWTKACEAAGVTDLHFHDLRHTGATLAAHSGATLAELMARLGHKSPTVALRYQHAAAHRDLAVADGMGALIAEIRTARTDAHAEQAEKIAHVARTTAPIGN